MKIQLTEMQAPLATPSGFRAIWARLGAPRRIVLAVSGGGDSMALMHLAAPLQQAGLAAIFVATVDHRLRPHSRAEADLVAAAASELNLSQAILEWVGEKPQTAVQASARRARYKLLVGYANSVGAEAVMTGHTADDQAETVILRAGRSSGQRGLAGIEETSLIAAGVSPPIRLLRPLLEIRRKTLRAYLADGGIAFVEDPTNLDRRFERVRIRQALQASEASGTDNVETIIEEARQKRIAALRRFREDQHRFAALQGAFDVYGAASVDASGLSLDDAPLITELIRAVAGADHAPPPTSAKRAVAGALSRKRSTLGGCILFVESGRLMVCREPAAVLGRSGVLPLTPVSIGPGARVLWDRRFIVANNLDEAAILGPVGEEALRIADNPSAALALSTCPGVWTGGALVYFPGENGGFSALATEKFHQCVNRFH